MSAIIVPSGGAEREARLLIEKEVRRRYAPELAGAGLLRRLLTEIKIQKEIRVALAKWQVPTDWRG